MIGLCAIVKNEALYIQEWLNYHRLIGVDRFFIYLNNCSDDTGQKIKDWDPLGLYVELINWPQTPGQLSAYQHCINTEHNFDWIIFIDIDEFLYSRMLLDIPKFLGSLSKDVNVVYVNWLIFGSSGHASKPNGGVLENFLKRSHFDFPANRIGKCIVRGGIGRIVKSPHFIQAPGNCCDGNGKKIIINPDYSSVVACHDNLVINHYFTKSMMEWNIKQARGRATLPDGHIDKFRTNEQFSYHDRCEVFDDQILQYKEIKYLDLSK